MMASLLAHREELERFQEVKELGNPESSGKRQRLDPSKSAVGTVGTRDHASDNPAEPVPNNPNTSNVAESSKQGSGLVAKIKSGEWIRVDRLMTRGEPADTDGDAEVRMRFQVNLDKLRVEYYHKKDSTTGVKYSWLDNNDLSDGILRDVYKSADDILMKVTWVVNVAGVARLMVWVDRKYMDKYVTTIDGKARYRTTGVGSRVPSKGRAFQSPDGTKSKPTGKMSKALEAVRKPDFLVKLDRIKAFAKPPSALLSKVNNYRQIVYEFIARYRSNKGNLFAEEVKCPSDIKWINYEAALIFLTALEEYITATTQLTAVIKFFKMNGGCRMTEAEFDKILIVRRALRRKAPQPSQAEVFTLSEVHRLPFSIFKSYFIIGFLCGLRISELFAIVKGDFARCDGIYLLNMKKYTLKTNFHKAVKVRCICKTAKGLCLCDHIKVLEFNKLYNKQSFVLDLQKYLGTTKTHTMRVSGVVHLFKAGATPEAICFWGRWRSITLPALYNRNADESFSRKCNFKGVSFIGNDIPVATDITRGRDQILVTDLNYSDEDEDADFEIV